MYQELANGIFETITMVLISGIFTVILSIPLGAYLGTNHNTHSGLSKITKKALNQMINLASQIPYLFVMIALLPILNKVFGKNYTNLYAIIIMSLAAIPLLTTSIANSLKNVPASLIETARTLGASPKQVTTKFLIPEAKIEIFNAIKRIFINLLSFATIAGALGAGGLGNIAMQRGYYSFQAKYVIGSIICLLVIIGIINLTFKLLTPKSAVN